jgi:flagellin
MSSILTNSAALTALQSLEMTQQALNQTQNEVSTGLKVSNAADNPGYWSIAQQLTGDKGVSSAANDALTQSQSILDTADSAVQSVISTIDSIQTTLAQASNPNADIGNINTALASLGKQLTDAVNGASFNGMNVLNGSVTTLNFVSGFNASSTGGSFNTIGFTAQALTGAGGVTTTVQQPNITDATVIGQLNALADNSGTATLGYGSDVIDKTTDTTGDTFTVASQALDGTNTTTTYTGYDANGNVTTAASAASFGVAVTTTPGAGLLTQSGLDLTNFTTTATTAATQLIAVDAALSAVTNYASVIGATQNRMTAAATFNTSLQTNYANGISGLVDADMNEASTRLQALQTQQQLGVQSLSVANQNSQLILKLFQ